MPLPLSGLLVVALEQAAAAPFCSSRLADAGARVIKVERIEGDFARSYDHVVDGESAYFVWLNRGKESICLNIKQQRDSELLKLILKQADVFIQNLAPGAAARAGFDSELLRERNSSLITVDISGYGDVGPYRDMKAYDLLIQCETGLASITGSAEGPGRVGVSLCDIACGMYAHAGVLAALIERQQTGQGKGLSVSLFDALADWLTVPLLHQEYTGHAPQRLGLNHPSIAPYGAYACQGGEQIAIAIQNDREWKCFCDQILRRPDFVDHRLFASNVARSANRKALNLEIDAVFSSQDRAVLAKRLTAAKIAFASVNSIADLSAHQQLRRVEVATPSGKVALVAPPLIVKGEPDTIRAVPALGAHTEAIRAEFSHRRHRASKHDGDRIDLPALRPWVGKQEVLTDTVAVRQVAAMSAALNLPEHCAVEGVALPKLWHWLYFSPTSASSGLGLDGHPEGGGFLPPAPLPRRMWAASQLSYASELLIGEEIERVSTIKDISVKHGSTGQLVFVTVVHEIFSNKQLAISEVQSLVYCEAVVNRAPPVLKRSVAVPMWSRQLKPDAILLFRYSALTFNSHRIHYDRDFAVNEEGYAGLVVQGPLVATLLLDLLGRNMPGVQLKSFQFRSVSPLLDIDTIALHGRRDGNKIMLWAENGAGALAMTAAAIMAN